MYFTSRTDFLRALGLLVLVLGSVLTIVIGVKNCLWDFDDAPHFETYLHCSQQDSSRKDRVTKFRNEESISKKRLISLSIILKDTTRTEYAVVRSSIAEEEEIRRLNNLQLKALSVQSVKTSLLFIVSSILLTMIVSLAGVYLIQKHSAKVPSLSSNLLVSRKTYWVIVGTIFGAMVLREVITSVLAIEKSWYIFFSFCVSTGAWIASLVLRFGLAMLIAMPLALLWLYSASDRCPKSSIYLDANDGQCGVGEYMLFVQAWAVLPVIAVIMVNGLIFQFFVDELRISLAYMIESTVLMVLFIIVAIRFVLRAKDIRETYKSILRRRGTKWLDIVATMPAPDPTMKFIGEHWWRLPAVVFGFIGVLWGLLEWFGLARLIRDLLGG